MDYLVCEEESAEILQFFTWFCDYVSRWTELSPQEMLLSPPWKPAPQDAQVGSALMVQSHRRKGSDRLEQILRIMDKSNATEALNKLDDQGHKRVSSDHTNFSAPRIRSGAGSLKAESVRSQRSNVSAAPTDEQQQVICEYSHQVPGDEQLTDESQDAQQPYR